MSGMGYGRISFGSLDEVIIEDGMTGFDEGYGVLKEGVEGCLDQGKARGKHCTTKTAPHLKAAGC